MQLLALNGCLIVSNLASVLYYCHVFKGQSFGWMAEIELSVGLAFGVLSQWVVTYIYLKAILEVGLLTDRAIYFDNQAKISQVQLHKRFLTAANITFILLSIALGLLSYYQTYVKTSFWPFISSELGGTFLEIVCALLWGCSLISLLRNLKSSNTLLPNLGLFKIHGILLVAYVFFGLVVTTLDWFGNQLTGDEQNWVFGFCSILYALTEIASTLSFLLVLYVTLPVTSQQQKRRSDFQTFLLNGFIDFDQLKQAVYDRNDLDEEEREIVSDDLDRFGSFLEWSRNSMSLVAEMVVVDPQYLAFQGELVLKKRDRPTFSEISQSYHTRPSAASINSVLVASAKDYE